VENPPPSQTRDFIVGPNMVVDEVDEVELKEIDLIDMELDSMSYQK
tara:strand:- start:81 stop:218 length:138 start_codon:yes stop_codon:yes gene_type:complete